MLIQFFIKKAAKDLDKKVPAIPEQLIVLLQNYIFPGNIRELQCILYEALSRHSSGKLSLQYFKDYIKTHNHGDTANEQEHTIKQGVLTVSILLIPAPRFIF